MPPAEKYRIQQMNSVIAHAGFALDPFFVAARTSSRSHLTRTARRTPSIGEPLDFGTMITVQCCAVYHEVEFGKPASSRLVKLKVEEDLLVRRGLFRVNTGSVGLFMDSSGQRPKTLYSVRPP